MSKQYEQSETTQLRLLVTEQEAKAAESPDVDPRQEWGTPQGLYLEAAKEWGPFGLDAAASHWNHKHENYLTAADDALSLDWAKRSGGLPVWLNPPWGELHEWLLHASRQDAPVVCLVPVRTGSAAWREVIRWKATQVIFLAKRVSYRPPPEVVGSGASPTEDSALVAFGPGGGLSCGALCDFSWWTQEERGLGPGWRAR